MLYLVGNGPSRNNYDLSTLERWWGMNMSYKDAMPDMLFTADIAPMSHAFDDEVYKTTKHCVGGSFNPIDLDEDQHSWDMLHEGMKVGHAEEFVYFDVRKPGDDKFVVQSESYYDELRHYFVAYSSAHEDNIVIYEKDEFKNLLCGLYALGYAVEHGETEICLVGFDSLEFDVVDNIYDHKDCHTYKDEYTSSSGVGNVQKLQFLSLLKWIEENYPNINVYFKNSVDGFDKIEYNDILNRYESEGLNTEDEWVLIEACFKSEITSL